MVSVRQVVEEAIKDINDEYAEATVALDKLADKVPVLEALAEERLIAREAIQELRQRDKVRPLNDLR
jgi:predicted house-cleaning noncanonical NTP pyrophosphatase (MazG superfamily)